MRFLTDERQADGYIVVSLDNRTRERNTASIAVAMGTMGGYKQMYTDALIKLNAIPGMWATKCKYVPVVAEFEHRLFTQELKAGILVYIMSTCATASS